MVGATSGIQDQQLTEQEDNSASSEETQRDVSLILPLFGFFYFFFYANDATSGLIAPNMLLN